MDADTVTAICATVIATASFVVSIQQTALSRRHNKHSVTPVLEIWTERSYGKRTGLSLTNHGLGPAFVTGSRVWLDGVLLGEWNHGPLDAVRQHIRGPHSFSAISRQPWVIPAGSRRNLLFADNYSEERNGDLWQLVSHRLGVEITYESVYGGEAYVVSRHPEPAARRIEATAPAAGAGAPAVRAAPPTARPATPPDAESAAAPGGPPDRRPGRAGPRDQ